MREFSKLFNELKTAQKEDKPINIIVNEIKEWLNYNDFTYYPSAITSKDILDFEESSSYLISLLYSEIE